MNTPYVSIEDGKLCLSLDRNRKKKKQVFSASKRGAKAMGRAIVKACSTTELGFMCSSSVDFPTEEGAPDLDYRALIEEGVINALGNPASVVLTRAEARRVIGVLMNEKDEISQRVVERLVKTFK